MALIEFFAAPVCRLCRSAWPARRRPMPEARSPDGRFAVASAMPRRLTIRPQAQALDEQALKSRPSGSVWSSSIPTALVPVDADQLRGAATDPDGLTDSPSAWRLRPQRHEARYLCRDGTATGSDDRGNSPRVGYAWQAERKPLLSDPLLVEGFRRMGRLQGAGGPGALHRHGSDARWCGRYVYGHGLRQVLAWQTDEPLEILERS